jgi:flavin reductase (DIM6/NTAB) family NADH-FMN oxidoreductase RutF
VDEGKHFRTVLGNFPTGVTVVTAVDDGEPAGLAIGSFTSVSLDPPLVAFCPDKRSSSWPHIEAAGAFCVNILAADQVDVCNAFAGKSDDKFDEVTWDTTHLGSPRLAGSLAWIDCSLEAVHDGGDHFIVVGRVNELDVERPDVGPLLFFRGGYGLFGDL